MPRCVPRMPLVGRRRGWVMLELRALSVGYGARTVLHDVSLTVHPGEVVAVLGRNGSGRSTLLRGIMGLTRVTGTVLWQGQVLTGLPVHAVARRGVAYVPEGREVFRDLTVRQNLALGTQHGRVLGRWCVQDVWAYFPALAARADALAGVLSGGEQQMLALARALMAEPDLLLVDEPSEGLAPMAVQAVVRALARTQAWGAAVILVEHQSPSVRRLAQRCVVLDEGRVAWAGACAEGQGAGVLGATSG